MSYFRKQFTAGFWMAEHYNVKSYITVPSGEVIAQASIAEDAQLIAEAPRLLYALQIVLIELEKELDRTENMDHAIDYAKGIISNALSDPHK